MTPFRVPSTVGTQIGAMWIEQQRAESCRGHGAGKGGQLAAARGGGVAGAELSASQAGVGALSRWGCESAAAWQLRASLQPSSPRGVSPSGARSGRQALCGLRADAGGGTLGGRRRTASGRRDPAALDESGRTLAPPASAKAVSPAQDAQAAFRRTGQLDASFHPWLEDRAANGCLMHMVDDATGTVLCQFSAGETTWAAAHLLRAWIERYGGPRALYTDWKNVYVRLPNVQERLRGEAAVTQFGQMCAKLGIRIIAASSPQAKGRVERVHGTHQDRLVKKLRLATVSNYDDANAYLQEHYIAQHNRHYARPAAAEADYHRQRPTARQLDDVFWLEEERVLSEDWVVRNKNRLLQLARQNRHWAPAQSRVRVRENEPGHIVIHYRGQSLPFREIPLASSTARSRGRGAAPSPATPSPKPTVAAGRPHRSPAGNHPWRQGWQNMKTPAFSPAW